MFEDTNHEFYVPGPISSFISFSHWTAVFFLCDIQLLAFRTEAHGDPYELWTESLEDMYLLYIM